MNLLEKVELQAVAADAEMAYRREIKTLVDFHGEMTTRISSTGILTVGIEQLESALYRDFLEKLVPILRESKQDGFDLKSYAEVLADDAEIDLFDDLEGV